MREILFRGKRKDNGQWHIGKNMINLEPRFDDGTVGPKEIYIIPSNTECYKYINNFSAALEWSKDAFAQIDPETVGQFTGLKDKNGKKIFEGDIVNTPRWVVTYCADIREGLGMNAGWYLQRDNFESWMELENERDHVVLGNIHDNPELLEVK